MAPGLVAGTFSNTSTGQDRQISVNITTENSKPSIFVQTTFAALGVSSLLPWNSMITTLPFFLDRLNRTPFHDNFASWLTFSSTGAGLFAMGLATWSGSRFTNSSGFTVSISVLICLFAFLAAIPFIPLSASAFFVSTLLVNGLLAFAGGFLQTSTVTLASKYGPIATASYMFGSALVAVGISALQAVTAYTSADVETPYKDSLSWSATICFIVSVIILFLTLVLYRVLEKDIIPLSSVLVNIPPSERSHLIPQRPQPSLLRVPQVDPRRTYEASYSCEFAAFYAGVVTLSFFPAVTTFIEPNGGMDSLVFIALHFLVFNIGDLAGRPLASLESISQTNNTFLVVYSLSRTLFVPFFLRCNIEGSSNPAIVTSDVVYMLGLFLLGLTHGHCTTLSLVAASEGKNEEDGGSAARLTQFWMAAGLAAGGAASFGMYKIVWDVVI